MLKSLATFLLIASLGVQASAREVDRQEVAERFDHDVPQEQRLYCSDTQMFTLADAVEYRACVNWRAQNRTRVVRSYAALDGPEDLHCSDPIYALNSSSYSTYYFKGYKLGSQYLSLQVLSLKQQMLSQTPHY